MDNKKTIVVVITCVIISALVLSMTFVMTPETTVTMSETTATMSDYIDNLSTTHTVNVQSIPYFDLYLTPDDIEQSTSSSFIIDDGIRISLNESNSQELIDKLKPVDGTVVIFPVFTAAAYHKPGFYTYFAGDCDESCITDLSFEKFEYPDLLFPVFG